MMNFYDATIVVQILLFIAVICCLSHIAMVELKGGGLTGMLSGRNNGQLGPFARKKAEPEMKVRHGFKYFTFMENGECLMTEVD